MFQVNSARVSRKKKSQISPLRYPGFPDEFGGVGELHATFLNESRMKFLHIWDQANGISTTVAVLDAEFWLCIRARL